MGSPSPCVNMPESVWCVVADRHLTLQVQVLVLSTDLWSRTSVALRSAGTGPCPEPHARHLQRGGRCHHTLRRREPGAHTSPPACAANCGMQITVISSHRCRLHPWPVMMARTLRLIIMRCVYCMSGRAAAATIANYGALPYAAVETRQHSHSSSSRATSKCDVIVHQASDALHTAARPLCSH